MGAAIVRKVFDNHNNNLTTDSFNYILIFDKFALKIFNQLSHNQEISKLLIVSYLLNLTDYYFLKIIVKIIYIALL